MPLAGVIVIIIGVVYLLSAMYSSYGYLVPVRAPKKNKRTIPDLRISEFAPDKDAALEAQPYYKMKEKERKEADQLAIREAAAKRHAEHDRQVYERYYQAVAEAKAKRWREGNPVTRENPLKEHEKPSTPYTSSGIYHGLY